MKQNQNVLEEKNLENATLGGGCFWCLEAIYDQLKGVMNVDSGYAGGTFTNPTYEQVCSGSTGHAEVVQITFDSQVISYKQILEVFFTIHDPTTINRQGADIGSQYRSVIFYHTPQQEVIARQVMSEIISSGLWNAPLVTELVPYQAFYKAEDYHQEYFIKNPNQAYCRAIILPKVAKFRKQHLEKLLI
jgi:peptide-methionine (S)-S-oxide reductase